MNFIPEQREVKTVPFFDDVTGEDGWQGHTTTKSTEALKAEVATALNRLGGVVASFQQGTFQVDGQERQGFKIRYAIESNDKSFPGEMDIAALPVRNDARRRRTYDDRRKQSLKMALYMTRDAMAGLWFLQVLWPGYAGLMPGMLAPGSDKTITQLWSESAAMGNLLPPGEAEWIDGEIVGQK